MTAPYYPEGSSEGLAEAGRTGAEELNIGGLGLTEVPEELFDIPQLKGALPRPAQCGRG